MKILAIGGTAFIGYHVIHELTKNGDHDITLFNRGSRPNDVPDGVQHIKGEKKDLADFKDEFKALAPDVVLDMIPFSDKDATLVMDTFTGIAKRIVMISSCDVYRAYDKLIGNQNGAPDPTPISEDGPLREEFYPYRNQEGATDRLNKYDKILAERVFMGNPNLPGTVLRLPMVYGPRDYQHRFFSYLKRMDDGRPAILLEESHANWRTTRGFVGDVAHGINLAITNDAAAGRIYNVNEDVALTEKEFVEAIATAAGWEGDIVIAPKDLVPVDMNTAQDLVNDSQRIRTELGFTEQTSMVEAYARTVEWERKNPPPQVNPDQFNYEEEDEILAKIVG